MRYRAPATKRTSYIQRRPLIAAWNERQAKRMPTLFSPTIGCALKARHWFLWVRCPACRTTLSVDLRTMRNTRAGRWENELSSVAPTSRLRVSYWAGELDCIRAKRRALAPALAALAALWRH